MKIHSMLDLRILLLLPRPVSCRALLLGVICVSSIAQAHDVRGTVIFVDVGRTKDHLEVQLPIDELRLALEAPHGPNGADLPGSTAQLLSYAMSHLQVATVQGEPFEQTMTLGEVLHQDGRDWLVVQVELAPPSQGSARDLVITSDLIVHRVPTHNVYVFLRHDIDSGVLAEAPSLISMLHSHNRSVHVDRTQGTWRRGVSTAFQLGLRHIAEGTDHLLFVLMLLLPATLVVAARRWGARRSMRESIRDVVRIVTAFTLGHSLTLLAGALGFARLPSALVESLIASSILVTAVHALRPLFARREAWVALGFGLIHGLAFAAALEGLGVDGSTLITTVLAFNLGVEVMQLLVVLVVLPWLLTLQGTRFGRPVRIVGALFGLVASTGWLLERALGLTTPIPAWVERVAAQAGYGLLLLVALSVIAMLTQRKVPV